MKAEQRKTWRDRWEDVKYGVEWWKWKCKEALMRGVMFGIGPEYGAARRRARGAELRDCDYS